MNNKVLALTAGISVWTTFFMGAIEGYQGYEIFPEDLFTLLYVVFIVSATWVAWRLYKVKDDVVRNITNELLSVAIPSLFVISWLMPDDSSEALWIVMGFALIAVVTMAVTRLHKVK